MPLPGFCFSLTDGQGALKLNSALIALCHLKFYLLHGFCLQVSGFQTFGSPFLPSLSFLFFLSPFFFFPVLGEIKKIVILCDREVFITTPCPERWHLRKRNYVLKSGANGKQFKLLRMFKYFHLLNKSNQKTLFCISIRN